MRSAGCIVNDISDRNFDKKVERTKNRPIASGKISVFLASIYASILCFIAFLVLINFNNLTIILAIEKNAVFGKLWRWQESVKTVIHSGLLLTVFFAWLVWYN